MFGMAECGAAAYVWVDAFRQYPWRAVPAVELWKSLWSGIGIEVGTGD